MRWSIVEKACGHGLPSAPALLEAEQLRDKSDRGQRAVLTAKSSFPDINIKHEAWARYTAKEQKLSSHNAAADMSGFRWHHQRELLSEFTDKFFDIVRSIYKDHPRQYAESFFSLFPGDPENDHVLERTERLLSELPSDEQILTKTLKEEIDDLKRARTCRALFKA
jgi:aminopeptidase N